MTVSIVLDVIADAGKVHDNFKFLVGDQPRREDLRVVCVARYDNVLSVCPDKRINQTDLVMVKSLTIVQPGLQLFTLERYKATYNLDFSGAYVVPIGQPVIHVSTPRRGVDLEYAPVDQTTQILFDGGRINNITDKTASIPPTIHAMWHAIPKRPVAGTNLYEVIGICVIRCTQQNLNKVIMATNVGKVPPETSRRLLAPVPYPLPNNHVHPPVVSEETDVEVDNGEVDDDEDEHNKSTYRTPAQSDDDVSDVEVDNGEVDDDEVKAKVVDVVVPTDEVRNARKAEMDAEIAYLEARLIRVRLERAAA